MLRELLTTPWWTYDPHTSGGWGLVYRWFNLAEGTIWLILAALVLRRWHGYRHSRLEIAYALTFLLFGLTDYREAWEQSAALVLVKGAILIALLSLRHIVLSRHYADRRLF